MGTYGAVACQGASPRVVSVSDSERHFVDELDAVPDEQFDESRFVPGVGSFDADVMFVGEAPGTTEVEESEPFVGQAGTELDRVFEDLGVDRSSVYITNLVKVRPPENRTPHVDEIEAWESVLDAELARIDPAVVVPLGTTATRALLDMEEGITDVHGQQFERDGRTVVPAFHPAATLYDRNKRGDLEADVRAAVEAV